MNSFLHVSIVNLTPYSRFFPRIEFATWAQGLIESEREFGRIRQGFEINEGWKIEKLIIAGDSKVIKIMDIQKLKFWIKFSVRLGIKLKTH